jgi:hypothetical protein
MLVIVAVACLGFFTGYAFAAPSLEVSAQKGLSAVGEDEGIAVQASAATVSSLRITSSDTQVVVGVYGPSASSQIGASQPKLNLAGSARRQLAAGDFGSDGSLRCQVTVPATDLASPGAYQVRVELRKGGSVIASGSSWLGRVAASRSKVDVAVVWPVTLGIHQDYQGNFYDDALEKAVAATGTNSATISGLSLIAKQFSTWRFTLAVEPVLLSQLADMSAGYSRIDSSGKVTKVAGDSEQAVGAKTALQNLQDISSSNGRDVIVTTYSGASVNVLGQEDWRDGFGQMQLGKQVAVDNLLLSQTPSGAYSSDLDITTEGIAAFSEASIDHIVVSSAVAGSLAEPLAKGVVTARVRDKNGQRATLVFADELMQKVMNSSWDIGLFYAGLAATLSDGSRTAVVITPGVVSTLPPTSYLVAVGRALQRFSWIRTCSVSDLLDPTPGAPSAHLPGSRPVLLNRSSRGTGGYVAEELDQSVQAAHDSVANLISAAGSDQPVAQEAQSMLYLAESGYWTMSSTNPQVTNVGLKFAEQAQSLASNELAKIKVSGFSSTNLWGRDGKLVLNIDNRTGYSVKLNVQLSPEGMTLPGGSSMEVDAPKGKTKVSIVVAKTDGSAWLSATVYAGTQEIATPSSGVRFLTVSTFIPWILGLVVVAGIGLGFMYRRRRSRAGR